MKLVVKDNALINASYSLSLVEQRIVLLAIIEARETQTGVDAQTFVEIHAQHYADRFDISVKNAYVMLAEASKALFNRQATLMLIDEKRNKPERRIVRWVSGVSYVEGSGVVKLRFSPEIIPLITQLEKNFTSYELSQVSNLGLYATRLYELIIAWGSVGKVPVIALDEFRNKMGLASEYKAMSDFKKRVLEPAIAQINEHTDITVSYQQHKNGRVITGFSFSFKFNQKPKKNEEKQQQRDEDTIDMFTGKSDRDLEIRGLTSEKQAYSYAQIIKKYFESDEISIGLDDYQLTEKIKKILLNPASANAKYQKMVFNSLAKTDFKH